MKSNNEKGLILVLEKTSTKSQQFSWEQQLIGSNNELEK